MKHFSIGLCVIVKNEEKNIERLIESLGSGIDVVYLTDTGSTDNTIELAKKTCAKQGIRLEVSTFKWVDDYSKARNYNFAQAKTDWILWLDADDTLKGSESLRKWLSWFDERGATEVAIPYWYIVGENGEPVVRHSKPRFVRNNMYKWVARIHENLFALDETKPKRYYNEELKVLHNKHKGDWEKSLERNIRILKLQEDEEGSKPDPRTVFLLGREYMTAGNQELALSYMLKYLTMSTWGGDKVIACGTLCSIYENRGDYVNQEKYAYEAVRALPDNPLGYLMVAAVYLNRGLFQKTIDWVNMSLPKKADIISGFIDSPADIDKKSVDLLVQSYAGLEKYEKAAEVLQKFGERSTDKELREDISEDLAELRVNTTSRKVLDSFVVMTNTTLGLGNLKGVKQLLGILPPSLRIEKEALTARRLVGLRNEREKGTVTIYCGDSYEAWDEASIKEKGAGGSETAVMEQAKRFGNMGYKVEVYNSVEEIKEYGNVKYLPFETIDWADKFDLFLSWRNPRLINFIDIQANKKFIWMHDVPNPLDFTNKVIDSVDAVILLSKFHGSLLPAVPEEKKYYTSNGIDLDAIVETTGVERNYKRVIYASSPDRGLENLLDMWVEIKAEVPDAELVWAYGWNTFDALRSGNPELMAWKDSMNKKMDELGVIQLGRLNKEELYKAYHSAGIWAYPTKFDEINCIVAQEAQAAGCYPITTGHAALAEVQKWGLKSESIITERLLPEGNNKAMYLIKQEIIRVLTGGEPLINDMRKYLPTNVFDSFSWDVTANKWANDLFYGTEIENIEPLVSVICITIRPGVFRVLRDTLEKQTYKNFELIIIDGRYNERAAEVAEFFKDVPYKVLHLPDPERDKKYEYGLFHADNAALSVANGELCVFLQDFILIPEDGLEKYVHLYRIDPTAFYTGVDTRNATKADYASKSELIDTFGGKHYEAAEVQFTSPRILIGDAIRPSYDPFEWELNWAAAPTKRLLEIGGWQIDWDKGFGYDNTEMALKHVYLGGKIIVDETNKATALSHWDLFPEDKEGVPTRDKHPNDKTFTTYLNWLKEDQKADVTQVFPEPKYSKELKTKISEWKKNER